MRVVLLLGVLALAGCGSVPGGRGPGRQGASACGVPRADPGPARHADRGPGRRCQSLGAAARRPGRDRPPRGVRGAAAGRAYRLRVNPDDACSPNAEVSTVEELTTLENLIGSGPLDLFGFASE